MNNKYLSHLRAIFVVAFLFSLSGVIFAQKNTDGTSRAMPADPRNYGYWEDPRLNPASRVPTRGRFPSNTVIYSKSKNKAQVVNDALKMANVFLSQGPDYSYSALDWFLFAISIDDKSVDAHIGLGKTYNRLKRYSDADTSFNKALQLKPDAVEALVGLSETHYRRNEFDKAIERCQQALKLEFASVSAHIMLGTAYFAQNLYTAAISSYKNAITFDSKSVEAHYNLAVTYLMTKNKDAALEEQRILLGLNENAAKMIDAWISKANQ